MAPISVHYSTPYCHLRRNAEDCFKIFRDLFQILDNPEEPQPEQDWALLLPAVTKSLNKRIIQSIGIPGVTREFKPKPPAGAPAGQNIYNKDAHDNCELLKPPDSKESKPLSNKKQDLKNYSGRVAHSETIRSTFGTSSDKSPKEEVLSAEDVVPKIEDELALEHLFNPPAPE